MKLNLELLFYADRVSEGIRRDLFEGKSNKIDFIDLVLFLLLAILFLFLNIQICSLLSQD